MAAAHTAVAGAGKETPTAGPAGVPTYQSLLRSAALRQPEVTRLGTRTYAAWWAGPASDLCSAVC